MIAHRQRGVALLMVVVLTAAVVALVATAQYRAALDMRRTTNLVFHDQALAYHLGAEDWACHLLRRDAEEDTVDNLREEWNLKGIALAVEGGTLNGELEDLQGRFNLSNLVKDDGTVDEPSLAHLRRLLDAVGISDTDRIAAAIVDWIDADQEPRGGLGAEDSFYLSLEPGYRTADTRLVWIGELRAVNGIDAATYALIAPHLAALPRRTAINVNTATLAVLQSLADGARSDPLVPVLARQREAPFGSVAEFTAAYGHAPADGILLAVESAHFALRTSVTIEGTASTMYSVLARAAGGATRPLRRSTDLTP